MKIKLTTMVLMVFLSITSCKKYLDKKPHNNLATPSTIEDLQSLLDNPTEVNLRTTPSYGQGSDDNYFLTETSFNGLSASPFLQDAYRWIPFIYNHNNDWATCYKVVYISNICLETIKTFEKTTLNANNWNNVKGSALYLRSYYFLNLLWNYSKAYNNTSSTNDLGIALREASDFNVPSFRSNVKDGYLKVINDTKEAIEYLPTTSQHVLRPSKAAGYGLLARAYLSMGQYDSALKYSDLCLTIKGSLLNYNSDIVAGNSVPFVQLYGNPEVIFYTEMNNISVASVQSTSRALIDTNLYASYSNNDVRKTAFFTPNGAYQKFKGTYTGNTTFFFSGIATDEMYLTRAECYARTGNKTSALFDLNTLLRKRYAVPFVDVTAIDLDDALNKILTERRKELIFRGLRWIDIKRLNMEGRNIILTRNIGGQSYILQPNANYYALPLPTDIISLTGMPQNPY